MKNTVLGLVLCGGMLPFLLAGYSCKKTVTIKEVDTFMHAWQQAPYFNTVGQPALSLAASNDSTLQVAGNSMMTKIYAPNFYQFSNFLSGVDVYNPVLGAPFLDSLVIAYSNGSSLFLSSTINFDSYSTDVYIPVFTPGSYSRFQTYPVYPSLASPAAAWPVIRQHYMMTPVESYPDDLATTRFDLVSFDTKRLLGNLHPYTDTGVAKSIYVHTAPGTLGWISSSYFCTAYYDKFFFMFGGQFGRMDTTGDVKMFGYSPTGSSTASGYISGMFTVGDTLFAKGGSTFFYSVDRGETWALFNDFSNQSAFGGLVFRNMGSDLYATLATTSMQIWKVDKTGNTFAFNELNNDGLGGYLVTGLQRCGKYVFASTTAGVFYRDTALFNQTKMPVRL